MIKSRHKFLIILNYKNKIWGKNLENLEKTFIFKFSAILVALLGVSSLLFTLWTVREEANFRQQERDNWRQDRIEKSWNRILNPRSGNTGIGSSFLYLTSQGVSLSGTEIRCSELVCINKPVIAGLKTSSANIFYKGNFYYAFNPDVHKFESAEIDFSDILLKNVKFSNVNMNTLFLSGESSDIKIQNSYIGYFSIMGNNNSQKPVIIEDSIIFEMRIRDSTIPIVVKNSYVSTIVLDGYNGVNSLRFVNMFTRPGGIICNEWGANGEAVECKEPFPVDGAFHCEISEDQVDADSLDLDKMYIEFGELVSSGHLFGIRGWNSHVSNYRDRTLDKKLLPPTVPNNYQRNGSSHLDQMSYEGVASFDFGILPGFSAFSSNGIDPIGPTLEGAVWCPDIVAENQLAQAYDG